MAAWESISYTDIKQLARLLAVAVLLDVFFFFFCFFLFPSLVRKTSEHLSVYVNVTEGYRVRGSGGTRGGRNALCWEYGA